MTPKRLANLSTKVCGMPCTQRGKRRRQLEAIETMRLRIFLTKVEIRHSVRFQNPVQQMPQDDQNDDIPDERGIFYDALKYFMPGNNKAQPQPPRQPDPKRKLALPHDFQKVDTYQDCEGWLLLQAHNNANEWRRKYCMLSNKIFTVFDEDKLHLRQPLITLNFDLYWFGLETKDHNSLEFELREATKSVKFTFRALLFHTRDQWVSSLNTHLAASIGSRHKLTVLSRVPHFWSRPEMSMKQMEHIGDHGDILLFFTENVNSTVQRFFTASDFDHVAMLVRCEDDSIAVIEATGNIGVEINPWKNFVDRDWVSLYKKICYRKLTCQRNTKFVTALSEFINNNVGKKYELNFEKLIKFQSILPGNLQQSITAEVNQKKYDSFFCSELVAAAYKACGLIPPTVSCSQFWPVTFSDKNSIDLLNGAKLEVQIAINTSL